VRGSAFAIDGEAAAVQFVAALSDGDVAREHDRAGGLVQLHLLARCAAIRSRGHDDFAREHRGL
jgi:hypothetical protein